MFMFPIPFACCCSYSSITHKKGGGLGVIRHNMQCTGDKISSKSYSEINVLVQMIISFLQIKSGFFYR